MFVSPELVSFQVPFEIPPGSAEIVLAAGNSPFESTGSAFIYSAWPVFIRQGVEVPVYDWRSQFGPVVAHADFDGLVTPANPARPGEVVHLYMLGLGAVTPPVETGQAAPPGPPARVLEPLACEAGEYGRGAPLKIEFAGLAPGMIGIYQASVRMPDKIDHRDRVGAAGGKLSIRCAAGGHVADSFLWVAVDPDSEIE